MIFYAKYQWYMVLLQQPKYQESMSQEFEFLKFILNDYVLVFPLTLWFWVLLIWIF